MRDIGSAAKGLKMIALRRFSEFGSGVLESGCGAIGLILSVGGLKTGSLGRLYGHRGFAESGCGTRKVQVRGGWWQRVVVGGTEVEQDRAWSGYVCSIVPLFSLCKVLI